MNARISPFSAVLLVLMLTLGACGWIIVGMGMRSAVARRDPQEAEIQMLTDIKNRVNEIKAGIQELKRRKSDEGMG